MRELLRRLAYLVTQRRREAELEEELAFHREMSGQLGGVPLGDPLRLREDAREAWGFMWVEQLGQDLRHGLRVMRRTPGFTVAALLVLTLGIGGTVGAFAAFNAVALRPLPVRDPASLVRFERHAANRSTTELSYRSVEFYRERSRTLSAVLAQSAARLPMEGHDQPIATALVTTNFFEELGATPASGRLLAAADARADAPPVVVLGHRFWTRAFGASPAIIGNSIRIAGVPTMVIGVAAPTFPGMGGPPPDVWMPIEQRQAPGISHQVRFWGRLAPATSATAAEEELSTLAAMLRRERPDEVWADERLVSTPAGTEAIESASMLALVVALAALVLAGACGNLGSLLMARGVARQREFTLRASIGASRSRLVRQLLTEHLLLAAIGSVGGLLVGVLALQGIMVWTDAPPWLRATPDWRVGAFTIAMGLLAAAVFGLAPVRHVMRPAAVSRSFSRPLLIGAQVTSSCVLLILAGLLVRGFTTAADRDPGFEIDRIVTVEPALLEQGATPEAAATYVRRLQERLQAEPGVAMTSVTTTPPLGDLRVMAALELNGRPLDVHIHQVDAQYLRAMSIPLLRGRQLTPADTRGVIVSDRLARLRWPGGDALGQIFSIGDDPLEVIGVTADARAVAPGDASAVDVYRLARLADFPFISLIVRTTGPADAHLTAIAAAAAGIDPAIRPRVSWLKERHQVQTADLRRSALAMSVLGALALAIACIGIAGLVTFAVAQRTRAIGIQIALGARPPHVVRSLIRGVLGPVAGGLLVGVPLAAGLAQLLRRELYGLSTIDPQAYAAATVLMLVAVNAAMVWPARRAWTINPVDAIRSE